MPAARLALRVKVEPAAAVRVPVVAVAVPSTTRVQVRSPEVAAPMFITVTSNGAAGVSIPAPLGGEVMAISGSPAETTGAVTATASPSVTLPTLSMYAATSDNVP